MRALLEVQSLTRAQVCRNPRQKEHGGEPQWDCAMAQTRAPFLTRDLSVEWADEVKRQLRNATRDVGIVATTYTGTW